MIPPAPAPPRAIAAMHPQFAMTLTDGLFPIPATAGDLVTPHIGIEFSARPSGSKPSPNAFAKLTYIRNHLGAAAPRALNFPRAAPAADSQERRSSLPSPHSPNFRSFSSCSSFSSSSFNFFFLPPARRRRRRRRPPPPSSPSVIPRRDHLSRGASLRPSSSLRPARAIFAAKIFLFLSSFFFFFFFSSPYRG